MQTLAEVGQALQQARLQKRLSQEELTKRAGVARVTLSRMETAANSDMSLSALLRLASALGYELRLVERGRQRTLVDILAEQQQGATSDFDKPSLTAPTAELRLPIKRRSSPRVRKRKGERET